VVTKDLSPEMLKLAFGRDLPLLWKGPNTNVEQAKSFLQLLYYWQVILKEKWYTENLEKLHTSQVNLGPTNSNQFKELKKTNVSNYYWLQKWMNGCQVRFQQTDSQYRSGVLPMIICSIYENNQSIENIKMMPLPEIVIM
jgi:hypothetical protein